MPPRLPAVALALVAARGGVFTARASGVGARLRAACAQHGYALSSALEAFELAYGGLVIPENDATAWTFGALSCLGSHAPETPLGRTKARKRVPVVYSPNDVTYFLDEQGRGYARDTIEDPAARLYAEDGRALVTRILLQTRLFELSSSTQERPGLVGAEWAKSLALSLVKEASGKDLRFYADAAGKTIIVEDSKAKTTRLASEQAPVADRTQAVPAAASELLPFVGKASVRMAFQKCATLPDVFAQLPELTELDVSGNLLSSVPDSLWRAPALKKLDLSHNPLSELSDAIADARQLRSLLLRDTALVRLPAALVGAGRLEKVSLSECAHLDVAAAIDVLARLPKLKELTLPLSRSLTTVAPLSVLGLRVLWLDGRGVELPERLPAGLGQLKTLTDLRIHNADTVQAPHALEDLRALRLIFSKRFSDAEIRSSIGQQKNVRYLSEFGKTL